MTRAALLATLAWPLALLAACGSKESPKPPAPAEADAVVAAAAPDTLPAPAEGSAWLAWTQDAEGALVTTLLVQEPGAEAPAAVGTREGVAAVAVDYKVWLLSAAKSERPLRPCDEEGTAAFEDLRVAPFGEAARGETQIIGDKRLRPAEGESMIHVERLKLVAQAGPWVYVHHWTNSDTCPVPATGAEFDVHTLVDLRTGERASTSSVYDAKELAAATVKAKVAAAKAAREEFPDAPAAAVTEALTLRDVSYAWGDDGALSATFDVYGESELFSELVGEPGVAGDSVVVQGLPKALSEVAAAPPAAVLAVWKAAKADGRGYSPVPWAKVPELRAWVSAEKGPVEK